MKTLAAPRRATALLAGLVSVGLVLAGCSSDSSDGATNGASSDSASSDSASSDGAFPVTIDAAYGDVTVEEKPERIVAVGTDWIGLLDVLGEKPIAVSGEASDLDDYPWLQGLYDGDFNADLYTAEGMDSPEAIAALDPDLILTSVWSADEQVYDRLSSIAPTYVGLETQDEGGDTSWQDNLASLAALTGHDEKIVDETEAKYEATLSEAAAKLPGLQGKTFQLGVLDGDDQQLWLTEYANEPIEALGLTPGDGQPTGEGDSVAANAPKYSLENIDQFSADVVFIVTHEYADPENTFRTAFEADPRVPELAAAKNGTLVYLYGPQWLAVNPPTPSSVQWWVDEVVPQLEASALNTGA
ncbi:ABC transporter substrate-binding protein [Rhodococcoides fascians]|jgi:iron complex transport system substrate-binding protein|uniref:ABC transporter substrate-binding protein n=1 Tax=Rhodococcoides fascians TaxID=1828 RepID=UPI0005608884|nr:MULTISPECIES: ABC transporter substrate-binding protein [Rhodococcus]OZE91999.1 ABC transporter substrate-binding protein [Rhodococcus sp. 15-1189-1-1a]OZF07389.1 ABC transporter substrate-binding protein [Rhodococcus sp. 14-2686-1-2]